jgi:hypothetical protein
MSKGAIEQIVENVLKVSAITKAPPQVVARIMDALAHVTNEPEQQPERTTADVLSAWFVGEGLTRH